VFDHDKILHKIKEKVADSCIFLDKNLSFPKDEVKRIDDLDFDIKFEHALFRSRLESDLNEVLLYEKKFHSLISTFPFQIVVIPSQVVQPVQNPPRPMA
jgi:hypothetical protein